MNGYRLVFRFINTTQYAAYLENIILDPATNCVSDFPDRARRRATLPSPPFGLLSSDCGGDPSQTDGRGCDVQCCVAHCVLRL